MKEITLLSQDTIDKIAAGEVVERPSSVVKELVENAVDAGANAVTVEIRDGGTSLIRITDNGSGIPKEQVQIAYMRHATSKIRQVEDLLTSGTLGFRGEALSSIAAVSQVEMITKTAGSLTGVRYVIEGGVEKEMEEIGAPEGTTFLVHNLFYNTPVRKKFLKSASAEAGYVSELMERLALSHPNIAFKFINNRDTRLHTSGNHNLRDIIYSIYGREIASNLLKVDADFGNIRISGFIGKPVVSRGNRNYENYFVNERYVKSGIIAKAIEDAYKAFMMSHRYPFTVLMIQIDTDEVDVNVHPQKLEVRFANQQEIYERVNQTVKEALLGKELIPEFSIDGPAASEKKSEHSQEKPDRTVKTYSGKKEQANRQDRPIRYPEPFEVTRSRILSEADSPYSVNYPQKDHRQAVMKAVTGSLSADGSTVRSSTEETAEKTGAAPALPEAADSEVRSTEVTVNTANPSAEAVQQAGTDEGSTINPKAETDQKAETEQKTGSEQNAEADCKGNPNAGAESMETSDAETRPESAVRAETAAQEAVREDAEKLRLEQESRRQTAEQMELFQNKLLAEESRSKHKLVGQVFDTYWIVEFEDKMYLIDQHAAHEKVMYERLMKQYREKRQTSQMITPPVIVTLSLQEEELLRRNLGSFEAVGFEISPFGGREYSISAVPDNLYGLDSRSLFLEILDGLSGVSGKASDEMICEKIASMSCKAAVKGNSRMSFAEADALISELLTLENPYNCPHGRPTIISMTKYELEKKFKRVV